MLVKTVQQRTADTTVVLLQNVHLNSEMLTSEDQVWADICFRYFKGFQSESLFSHVLSLCD